MANPSTQFFKLFQANRASSLGQTQQFTLLGLLQGSDLLISAKQSKLFDGPQ